MPLRILRNFRLHAGVLSVCVVACGACAAATNAGSQDVSASRLNNLGVALMNQQLTEKAVASFDQAHQAEPSSPLILINKGIGLLYLQKLPEAEDALGQAAKLAPQNPRVWYVQGLLARMEGKPQVAVDDFQKVVAINANDADAHYFLGTAYLEEQQFDHALAEFQTALRLNPVHASSMFGLARALQRLGKGEQAQAEMARFTQVRDEKIASPLTANYGEQGDYARVQDILLAESAVAPMIPVSFVADPVEGSAAAAHGDELQGGGMCMLDVAGDGPGDMVAMSSGADAIRVYRNTGKGSFDEIPSAQTGLAASGDAISCAVGDYDNDGLPDLAVAMGDRVLLFHNLGHGKFADVTAQVGIRSVNHPAGMTFVDFDHDGDLDLFVTGAPAQAGAAPNVLWRNNGNSTFTEWTGEAALGGQGTTTAAVLSDVNNDRAVDLVVTGSSGAPTFFANPREGHFKASPLYGDAALAPSAGIVALDFNKDDWMDFAVTHAGAPGLSLWRNVDGTHFERVALPTAGIERAWGVTAIDLDNDGWLDLVAVVQTAQGTALRAYRNRGPQGFDDVTDALGLNKIKLHDARSVIAADVNGDGAADLIVSQPGGPPMVLRNVGGSRNHSLRLDLAGLADNKSALGTKVEVLVDGHQQKFEVEGGSGYLSQGSLQIIAGLGQATHVDVVRLLWPTGVPQDEIGRPADTLVAIKELDRRGSSCPTLFAWDGTKYRFISDVIGAGVVGHWVSPHATNDADPDEWVKVDGADLKASNGYLSLRFGEPMEEINFIDQLRLVAVDHPIGTEVFPDEKFLSEPPFASGATVVASHPRPVVGAWDEHGKDVSGVLRTIDHTYLRDFTNLKFEGFATPHTLTLDLGAWNPKQPLRLLMHGYVEYFSASSMYAAWQSGLKPEPPSVEALMPDGSWKPVLQDMGFPAGLTRTIVVDLTGKLPAGVRKIRIKTNLQIYWDQVLVDNDAPTPVRETELPLGMAHLAFRGYPEQVERATPGDLTYNYQKISATGPFVWQRGSYTRYGLVTPLLQKVDDQYVIFGSGQEIDAEFKASVAPPLPPHWTRDYFFYANGFVKDMDFYEASPFTVAELPFQGMAGYPYPQQDHYPETPATVRYQLNWDTRIESGNRIQPYRFDYKQTKSRPMTTEP
jgi:tetratricopeptide (TPR) repeat protein